MIAWLLMKQIASLFLMMAGGFLLVRAGVLRTEDSKVLSVLCVDLILPCVMIHVFQIDFSQEIRNGFLLALADAVLIHMILLILGVVLEKLLHLNETEKASIIYSNSGNLIIPLVTAVLGGEWVIYASAFMIVQMFFLWSHGQSLMQGEKRLNIKKIVGNVNLICILIGLLFFVVGYRIPSVISDAMGSISAMVGPVGMIALGMIIAGADCKKIFTDRSVWKIIFFRMLFVPGVILLFLKYSGLSALVPQGRTILLISLLATATPSATTIVQMAQIYHKDEEYAAKINFTTTCISILSMPLIVFLYQL